jgi:hypothetical protein
VAFDREGAAETAFAAVLLDDGRRAWANTSDQDRLAELLSGAEQIGREATIAPDGLLL